MYPLTATAGRATVITDKVVYLVANTELMLINLQKNLCFNKEGNSYDIGYIFKRNVPEDKMQTVEDIWMMVTVSVNGKDKRTYKVSKPTSFLYQSNEVIEKLISEEILSITQESFRVDTAA